MNNKVELNEELGRIFWKQYIKLDEFKRRGLLLQLTGIDKLNVTLMQSYFDDLIEVLK